MLLASLKICGMPNLLSISRRDQHTSTEEMSYRIVPTLLGRKRRNLNVVARRFQAAECEVLVYLYFLLTESQSTQMQAMRTLLVPLTLSL